MILCTVIVETPVGQIERAFNCMNAALDYVRLCAKHDYICKVIPENN